MTSPYLRFSRIPPFAEGLAIQRAALKEFHRAAGEILGATCRLRPLKARDLAVEQNMISALFLAVERAAGLAPERLPIYALVNQCLRNWVTACDNILDDEDKPTLPFRLPKGGSRFRAVLTILVTDRLAAELAASQPGSEERRREISRLTLAVLMPSGLQEHEEEPGRVRVLTPEALLARVHNRKTGMLFEAPIRVAEALGEIPAARAAACRRGLHCFGLACQVMDDMADFRGDLARHGHNWLVSWMTHELKAKGGKFTARQISAARVAAWQRSRELFADARQHLAKGGLRLPDAEWATVLEAISARMGVEQPR